MALIDKASLLMVPSTYEEGTLYNVLPSGNRAPDSTDQNSGYDQTRADFTFDRGSNAAATRIGSDGLIKKYRENLLLQSNQFDTWSITSGSSVTSGQSGYDGSSDAWLLNDSGNNSAYCIYRGYTNTGVQTFSIYAKQASTSQLEFDFLGGSGGYLRVNLTDGSIHQNQSTIDYNIEDVGDGWYRCSFSSNHTSAPLLVRIGCNGAGSIYIQNAQVESGLVSTDVLTSGATTAKAGVLIDLPRINYDANGENGSLLLEPSRLNLLLYSEYIGGWLNAGGTSSQNSQDSKSPEGVYNAAVLDASSVRYRSFNISSSAHSYSVYAKAKSGSILGLRIDTPTTKTTNFDLSDGTIQSTGSGHTASIEDAGNGWYRCVVSFTDSIINAVLQTTSSGSVYVWGAQLEAGSYSTSYIPNHGESGGVTRAADSCLVTGASDVIGQTEGTLFVEAQVTKNGRLFLIGATGNFIELVTTSGGVINAFVYNGSTQANINGSTTFDTGDTIKVAFAYKANDFALYVNGTANGTDTSGAVPSSMAQIIVNDYLSAGYNSANGYKQLALFNERLSNAELATLTTL